MTTKQCPCCKRAFRDPVPPARGKDKGKPFGTILLETANKVGLTSTEIARRLDTHVSRVQQIFAANNMTERTLRETAAALGVEVEVRLKRRKTNGYKK